MIQQRPGDLLEIIFEGNFYYVVVLTKIVQFGGNIVFAYHTDGKEKPLDELLKFKRGFNICTDLLMPKKEGNIKRIHRFDKFSEFWMSKFVKSCHRQPNGVRAKKWYIHALEEDGTRTEIGEFHRLRKKYRTAMDSGTSSFDLVAEKILRQYSPDQHPNL